MPIPLLVYAGIAGGQAIASWLSARSAARASERAATTQQEGVREARAYAEPLYQRAQDIAAQTYAQGSAALAPYAQQGTAGLTALSDFLGVRAPAAAPTAVAPMAAVNPVAPPVTPPPMSPAASRGGGPVGAIGSLAGGLPSSLFGFGGVGGQPSNQSLAVAFGVRPAPPSQSSYVRLRAPNGQTKAIPADQVDFYLARGATRV